MQRWKCWKFEFVDGGMTKLKVHKKYLKEMINQRMDLLLYKKYRDRTLRPIMDWEDYLLKYENGYLDRNNMHRI